MMSTLSTENRRAQAGFTLVELAIVLVIVGLLIGGILKGQELIAATRVNSTVSLLKAVDAATYTFRDTYGGIPGDLTAPGTRLPNCANTCVPTAAGINLGNGTINNVPGTAVAAASDEGTASFPQLAAASLISGVLTNSAAVGIGQAALGTPLGGGTHLRLGTATAGVLTGSVRAASVNAGRYLVVSSLGTGTAVTAVNLENGGISPKKAQAIDLKVDDGVPNTGAVLAGGDITNASTATSSCTSGGAGVANQLITDTYNTRDTQDDCGLFMRIDQ